MDFGYNLTNSLTAGKINLFENLSSSLYNNLSNILYTGLRGLFLIGDE